VTLETLTLAWLKRIPMNHYTRLLGTTTSRLTSPASPTTDDRQKAFRDLTLKRTIPMPDTLPYPFATFHRLAILAEKSLRRFVIVADLFASGCTSLSKVAKRTESLPDGFGLSTIRALPSDLVLVKLLDRCFDRRVELYRQPKHDCGPVTGLTEDGLLVAQMAREYLATLDEPSR
jgi:hypothetical protein